MRTLSCGRTEGETNTEVGGLEDREGTVRARRESWKLDDQGKQIAQEGIGIGFPSEGGKSISETNGEWKSLS